MQDQNPALKDENPYGVAMENYGVEVYPLGWRFSPTDVEAIYCYLKNKVENRPLPTVNIKEVDIYKFNPEDLVKRFQPNCDRPKEWYFFTPRDRKYRNGKRPNRKAGDGFWKATGADKEVKLKGKVIGWKRALVFYSGKPRKGEKTSWIMHEYMLKDAHPSSTMDTSSNDMKLDVCVLSKIYKNTRKSDIEQEQYTSQNQSLYTFPNQPSLSQNQSLYTFENQPSSTQNQSLCTFQNQPSLSYQYMQLGPEATIVNSFPNQPSSYQCIQLGTQATSTENIFQNQPSLSSQYMQLGDQATIVNSFQNQPFLSYQCIQLGTQATSTKNIFQNQPSSSPQFRQLGGQQMGYLNPTPLNSFPSAFDPQKYSVNTAIENHVNNVLFPKFSGVPGNFGDDTQNNNDVNM